MSNYPGHFLATTKEGQTRYSSEPLSVKPGTPFTHPTDQENTVLLAGGFPNNHPDSAFPLSVTLQCNGDLTTFDAEALTSIATAELNRYNSQSYRTYGLDADNRVTVIAKGAPALHAFIDTYGGLLKIDPILSEEYDPELTTGHDIVVKNNGNELAIHFKVKQPVNIDHCTYCGECGPACPENCLNEQLFLDFSQCTLCQECVTACQENAIDLHIIETRELTTPSLLLLEEVHLQLPENSESIYTKSDLPALFKNIYDTEIEEIITWDAAICQYSGRLGIGCDACSTACPHQAIQQGKAGVSIDHHSCVECGACLASCPTGALHYKRFEDKTFNNYLSDLKLPQGTTVVLGEATTLHRFWWRNQHERYENVVFIEYPQPAALHAMHLLMLFAMGTPNILILSPGSNGASNQITLTNSIIEQLLHRKQTVQVVTADSDLSALLVQAANGTVPDDSYHNFSYSNRRTKLMEIVRFLAQRSNTEPEILTDSSTAHFGVVHCDADKCTGCLACVGECRIGALTSDEKSFSLRHTPSQCVQCGICAEVCPEKALTLAPGLLLDENYFTKQLLVETEPAKCKSCGKIFGTKKSLEKVISILSSKGMWDTSDDLLSYCDDCRVINLYKTGEHERANRTNR